MGYGTALSVSEKLFVVVHKLGYIVEQILVRCSQFAFSSRRFQLPLIGLWARLGQRAWVNVWDQGLGWEEWSRILASSYKP